MEVKLSKQQKVTVNGSENTYLIMRQILRRENKIGQAQEHFWMVGLNRANKILYIELVALGSSNMANINPREAFRMAIYKLAVQVIGRFSQLIRLTFGCKRPNAAIRLLSNFQAQCRAALGA